MPNASAKFNWLSSEAIEAPGFKEVLFISQLCDLKRNVLKLLLVKIEEHCLLAGLTDEKERFISYMKRKFPIGTIAQAPGILPYSGLRLTQSEEGGDITVDLEDDV
eukprot:Plantae.Rhodophyta-Rhodochaete_pulchella.ctg74601.p2 GENE.Plantae.Rhodophyta-Rhodochaete_pulchella.ctg74601~~Plantae.Rhodophyta-Rhodochaete_pulchella.ctg74601.p2  ORF type:complete len:106 (-),score=21.13 Plantae.Rhodophyta-Rhodochaete_pulchella.ctg74601:121-438(-)